MDFSFLRASSERKKANMYFTLVELMAVGMFILALLTYIQKSKK